MAETSLTINGIKVVIDCGLDREMSYDFVKKMSFMVEKKITQSQAKQRAGRAGRTSPGICIRLYSEKDFYERDPFKQPEIMRTNLDNVVLRLK
jgi:ATP-dependent helicase HrpA